MIMTPRDASTSSIHRKSSAEQARSRKRSVSVRNRRRTSMVSGRSTDNQRIRPLSTRQAWVSSPSARATTVPSGCSSRNRRTCSSNRSARST